jgi:predicted nuclease with TOPRIM domain
LDRENKRLKLELETCRRQLADNSPSKYEADYNKEIAMWRNKANEYQAINEKLIAENNRLKTTMRSVEEEFEAERGRLTRENKKSLTTIVELQQIIDELRSRSTVQPTRIQDGPSATEIEEYNET